MIKNMEKTQHNTYSSTRYATKIQTREKNWYKSKTNAVSFFFFFLSSSQLQYVPAARGVLACSPWPFDNLWRLDKGWLQRPGSNGHRNIQHFAFKHLKRFWTLWRCWVLFSAAFKNRAIYWIRVSILRIVVVVVCWKGDGRFFIYKASSRRIRTRLLKPPPLYLIVPLSWSPTRIAPPPARAVL